jgi:hypothetical protein
MQDNCNVGRLLTGRYWLVLFCLIPLVRLTVIFLPGPDQDLSHIIPNPIGTAVRSLVQGHSHIATRKYATRRARRAQEFLKGDLVLVLVAALN